MTAELERRITSTLNSLRGLASRGPDSAVNMQLLAKINELQRLISKEGGR